MRLRILILDDDKNRHSQFFNKYGAEYTITYTYDAKSCIKILEDEVFDVVFLDHDLGGKTYCASDENSGYAVAKWLSENPDRCPSQCICHSLNPVGRKNICDILKNCQPYPFAWI